MARSLHTLSLHPTGSRGGERSINSTARRLLIIQFNSQRASNYLSQYLVNEKKTTSYKMPGPCGEKCKETCKDGCRCGDNCKCCDDGCGDKCTCKSGGTCGCKTCTCK